MLRGRMPKLSAAIAGMRPTKVSEKNENSTSVVRMRRMSGSCHASRNPDSRRATPVSSTTPGAYWRYRASTTPATAKRYVPALIANTGAALNCE